MNWIIFEILKFKKFYNEWHFYGIMRIKKNVSFKPMKFILKRYNYHRIAQWIKVNKIDDQFQSDPSKKSDGKIKNRTILAFWYIISQLFHFSIIEIFEKWKSWKILQYLHF